MPGQTTFQRHAVAGVHVAPTLGTDILAWAKLATGKDQTCTFAELATLLNTLSQQVVTTPVATATYTPTAADISTLLEFTGAAGHVLSLPTDAAQPNILVGHVIAFAQIGSGAVTFPPGIVPGTPTAVGGVTYDIPVGLSIVRFVNYNWRKRAANEWVLS